jgi:serine/threonine-protein kinase
MPLLEGETLAARLARGRLDLATARRYFADLAGAVSTIHSAGLIHRDIKPENVILCVGMPKGIERPVLLDLGIARDAKAASSTTTEQGNIRGTRAYMAPERFFGAPATIATDVYELAVLLYIMLVGQAPWDSDDSAASRLHPRDPSDFGVELSDSLKTTLLRALSTRPEVRPASVDAFADAVKQEALEPPRITGVVTVEESPPSPKPRRLPWLVGGGAVLALGGLSLFALQSRPARDVDQAKAASVADTAPPALSSAPPVAVETAVPVASASDAAMASTRSATPAPAQAPRQPHANRPPMKTEPSATAQPVVPSVAPAPTPPATQPTLSPDRLYGDRK